MFQANYVWHCFHCKRGYADWQIHMVENDVCVECGEPMLFKEEVESWKELEEFQKP